MPQVTMVQLGIGITWSLVIFPKLLLAPCTFQNLTQISGQENWPLVDLMAKTQYENFLIEQYIHISTTDYFYIRTDWPKRKERFYAVVSAPHHQDRRWRSDGTKRATWHQTMFFLRGKDERRNDGSGITGDRIGRGISNGQIDGWMMGRHHYMY